MQLLPMIRKGKKRLYGLAGRENDKFARACVAFLNGLSLDKVKHAENFSYKQR
jgi:hypothetical protein